MRGSFESRRSLENNKFQERPLREFDRISEMEASFWEAMRNGLG